MSSPIVKREDRAWQEQYIENRWLGLGDTSKIEVVNPFLQMSKQDLERPDIFVLNLMRKPENFGFTVKHLFGKTLAPFQIAILNELWTHPFPMLIASRGAGKSFLLALYSMLRGLFTQGSKIVIVGAAFRQAKVVFDYCQDLWEQAPILQDIVGRDRRNGPRRDIDRCTLRMGDSLIVALPLGTGEKIRGQRGNIIIAEEFATLPKDIFETVVRGFGAVSLSPVGKMQEEFKKRAIKELGLWTDMHQALEDESVQSNQTIISGTAFYAFNHFYEYWVRYKRIVESGGDQRKLAEIFGEAIPAKFSHRDYSVIRLPIELVPEGFMDEKNIAQAKATVHSGTYMCEYSAVFAADSNGFFKRSLIESCVVGSRKDISHPSCGQINFHAVLRGQPKHHYIMAVDPASERDNFSIVIIECHPDHRRVVFCWTINRARHKAKVKRGIVDTQDFFAYAARKIRDLLKVFNCERVAIDSQGGGIAIIEALQDDAKLLPGERKILPMVDPENPKDTDATMGEHILEIISFADANWVAAANHGMRKDFEDKALLFPEFDPAILAISFEQDKEAGRIVVDQHDASVERLYDTLEDCVLEIEELKDELASIVHTQTGTTMRDRWDTPETKVAGGKKGRLRKDRYTSLLMANMVGRTIQRAPKEEEYKSVGGFAHEVASGKRGPEPLWVAAGPDGAWWAERARQEFGDMGEYGMVVNRRGL